MNDSLNGCQSRGKALPAGKEVLLPLPKNSTSFDLSNFFIHCGSNGISSATGCILFRNDDIQGLRLGDIQNFVLMISTALP